MEGMKTHPDHGKEDSDGDGVMLENSFTRFRPSTAILGRERITWTHLSFGWGLFAVVKVGSGNLWAGNTWVGNAISWRQMGSGKVERRKGTEESRIHAGTKNIKPGMALV